MVVVSLKLFSYRPNITYLRIFRHPIVYYICFFILIFVGSTLHTLKIKMNQCQFHSIYNMVAAIAIVRICVDVVESLEMRIFGEKMEFLMLRVSFACKFHLTIYIYPKIKITNHAHTHTPTHINLFRRCRRKLSLETNTGEERQREGDWIKDKACQLIR